MTRIASMIERLEREAPSDVREEARALTREVLAYHADALTKIVETLSVRDPGVLADLRRDPLVASVFDLHGLALDPSLIAVSSLLGKKAKKPEERCDMCGAAAGARHAHLVELASARVRCSCLACATVLDPARFRRASERVVRVSSLADADAAWRTLGVPVGIAFFVREDAGTVRAHFPGAAGAVVSAVPEEAFRALEAAHPELGTLAPEAEALVVNRVEGAREHWIVGVDRAYALAGRLRTSWTGFSGGDEVRREIATFFGGLQ